jgi:translation initiation factor RLI1
MAGDVASVDYTKCLPESCDSGICAASLACSHKILMQLEPYEMPMMNPIDCLGCGDCAQACTLNAISVTRK